MTDILVRYFKKLYIAESSTSGQGLFAGEPIVAGELILSFGGMLAPAAERHKGNYMKSTFVGLTDSIVLCEEKEGEKDLSDYINHSCDPNAGLYDCLTIMAIRDICKDEEICCDYAFWEASNDWVLKSPCMCGSPWCRHTVTGLDWKKVKSTDSNFPYYSPFLKRKILECERAM